MSFSRKAESQQEVLGFGSATIFSLGNPPAGWLVEVSANNTSVEGTILLDVQLLLDVLEVGPELVRPRVTT
jgi:hypothetical protein